MDWKDRSAYVFIKTKEGKANEIWKRFHDWHNMIGTWIVTGEYDVIAWFDAENWDVIHDCVATIKDWDEVDYTSTHMVHNGHKDEKWWWEKPVGTWVLLKENKLDEAFDKLKDWNWMTSTASIPGEWDYMTWVEGDNWDEVWNHILEIKEEWDTSAQIPIKSWWDESWRENWWQ
ncbi:MAG: hypothetical protein V5A68_03245 [Candidatus Thermoplasmatota archaeon]